MFSTTHITATAARDTRSVLLAEPSWRFGRRKPQTSAATTAAAPINRAGTETTAPDNLREFRPRTREQRPAAHGQAARSGLALGLHRSGRIALPLGVTAVAVALTASVDTIARVVLGAL